MIYFQNKFSAERVYDNFDGYEIELSGCKLDLRFLPADLDLNKKPQEICEQLLDSERKSLPRFITKSLGHSEIELTWEHDTKRDLQDLYKKVDEIDS